jgi:Leucine-rich repeat (LRR) protein
MLDGLESLLDKKQVKAIGPMLSMLKQTQTLILRYAGLKKLEGLVLPQLVMLDLSHNKITEVNSLEISLRQCPAIQQLNLRDNPICAGGDWKDQFPSASAKVWKALVFVPTLEVLNGVVIPNSVRAPAFERASPKALRQRVPDLLFNIAVNQSSRVLEMESWQPFQIERINLGSQALTIAHLGSFKGLLELNLSYNRLPTLQGLGLEQCVRLRRLAVTHNALTKANNYASIQPLAYLPALRELV